MTKNVTIRFPDDLWKKVRLAILDGEGKSIQDIVINLTQEWVSKVGKKKRKTKSAS